jgi:kynurenine formamidase
MYIDLTHTFKSNMPVYPGDSFPELVKAASIEKDGVVDYQLKSGMHVGTHMDAPAHMLEAGKYLHEYPAEKFFGRGVLIDARGKMSTDADLLSGVGVKPGDIVLVMFGFSQKFNQPDYYKTHPELTEAFANKLVELGVSIVGMDIPSPDRAPYQVHKILLGQDILIIENLTNLEALIGKQNFEVIALPMKLQTEAAFCRVVAKII